MNPAAFTNPVTQKLFGGNEEQWRTYDRRRQVAADQQQRQQAADEKAREREAAAAAKTAETAARQRSYLDVLGKGQTPDLDPVTKTYFPKTNPATGQPERRTFTTGERPDPAGSTVEVKRNDQGKMEVIRPKVPAVTRNANDPNDFSLYRGQEKIDPVAGLRHSEDIVRQESAAVLRSKRLMELRREADDAETALADLRFESVGTETGRTAVEKARAVISGYIAEPPTDEDGKKRLEDARKTVSLADERTGLMKKRHETLKERARVDRLDLPAWTREALEANAERAGSDMQRHTSEIQARLQARKGDIDAQRAALDARAARWEEQQKAGVPAEGFEAHAREAADIRSTAEAIAAQGADFNSQVESAQKWQENAAGEEWFAAERRREMAGAKREAKANTVGPAAVEAYGAVKAEGAAVPAAGATTGTQAAATVKPLDGKEIDRLAELRTQITDLGNERATASGPAKLALTAKIGALQTQMKPLEERANAPTGDPQADLFRKALREPVPANMLRADDSDYGQVVNDPRHIPELMASPGWDGRDLYVTRATEADKGTGPGSRTDNIRMLDAARDQFKTLQAKFSEGLDNMESGFLRRSGADEAMVAEALDRDTKAMQKKFAKPMADHQDNMEAARKQALAGLLPMNRVIDAYREAGRDTRVAPDPEKFIDAVAGSGEQTVEAQKKRLDALNEYVKEWNDTPAFDSAKVAELLGKQEEQLYREELRKEHGGWAVAWRSGKKFTMETSVKAIEAYRAIWNIAAGDDAALKNNILRAQAFDEVMHEKDYATVLSVGDQFNSARMSASDWGYFGAGLGGDMVPQMIMTGGLGAISKTAGQRVAGGFLKLGLEPAAAEIAAARGISMASARGVVKDAFRGVAKVGPRTELQALVATKAMERAGSLGMKGGIFASSYIQNAGEYVGAAFQSLTPEDVDKDPAKVKRAIFGAFVAGVPAAALDMLDGNERKLIEAATGAAPKQLKRTFMSAAARAGAEFGVNMAKEAGTGYGQGLLGVMSQRFTDGRDLMGAMNHDEAMSVIMNVVGEALGAGQMTATTAGVAKGRQMYRNWQDGRTLRVQEARLEQFQNPTEGGPVMPMSPRVQAGRAVLDGLKAEYDAAVDEGRTEDVAKIRQLQILTTKAVADAAQGHQGAAQQVQQEIAAAGEAGPRAAAVLRVAAGEDVATMMEAEIAALGYERAPDGGVKPMKGVLPAVTKAPGGTWVVTDAAIAETESVAPSAKGLIRPERDVRKSDAAKANADTDADRTGNAGASSGTGAGVDGGVVPDNAGAKAGMGAKSGSSTKPGASAATDKLQPPREFSVQVKGEPEPRIVAATSAKDARAQVQKTLKKGKLIESAAEVPGDVTISGPIPATAIAAEDAADYERAFEVVLVEKKANVALLQRRLRLGYGRAARMIDLLEQQGIIGPAEKGLHALLAQEDKLISGPSEEGGGLTGAAGGQTQGQPAATGGNAAEGPRAPEASAPAGKSDSSRQGAKKAPRAAEPPAKVADSQQNAPADTDSVAGGPEKPGAPSKTPGEHIAEARRQLGKMSPAENVALEKFFGVAGRFLPHFDRVFSGVRWSRENEASAGFSVNTDTLALHLSLPRLAHYLGKTKDGDPRVADPRKWALAALGEEAIHAVTLRLMQEGKIDLAGIYARLAKEAPKTVQKFLDAYRGAGEHAPLEFIRMVAQGRITLDVDGIRVDGELTEQQYSEGLLQQIKAALLRVLDVIRNLAANMPKPVADAVNAQADAIAARLRERMGPPAEGNQGSEVANKPKEGGGTAKTDKSPAMTSPATKESPKSSTQFTLSKKDAAPFLAFANSIPDTEVYHKNDEDGKEDYGVETEPHVTALYGLLDHSPAQARALLEGNGPVEFTTGKMSIFENDEYDVLKVEISGPAIHAINAKLRGLPHFSTFPDYRPHMTLAYLKKGEGKKYVGDNLFRGRKLSFDTLTFSPPSEVRKLTGRTEIRLTAPAAPVVAKPATTDKSPQKPAKPIIPKVGQTVTDAEGFSGEVVRIDSGVVMMRMEDGEEMPAKLPLQSITTPVKQSPAPGATGDGGDTTGSREQAGDSVPQSASLPESDTKPAEVKPSLTAAQQRLKALRDRLEGGGAVKSQAVDNGEAFSLARGMSEPDGAARKDSAPPGGLIEAEAKAKGFSYGPVHHGTNAEFDSFGLGGVNTTAYQAGGVIWFSTSDEAAKTYGKNLKTAYLKLSNPFVYSKRVEAEKMGIPDPHNKWDTRPQVYALALNGTPHPEWYNGKKYTSLEDAESDAAEANKNLRVTEGDMAEAVRFAKENGHDGIIFKNINDAIGKVIKSDVYGVFDPSQILVTSEKSPAPASGAVRSQAVGPAQYSRDIPRTEVAELRDIAESLYFDDGINTPEKLAESMNALGFQDLTENVWSGIREINATLPAAVDWRGVYAGLDKAAEVSNAPADERELVQRPEGAETGDPEAPGNDTEPAGDQSGGRMGGDESESDAPVGGGRQPSGKTKGGGRKGGRRDSGGAPEGNDAPERPGDTGDGRTGDAPAGGLADTNYRITASDALGKGGLKEKYADNIAAIRLLKALQTEGRRPTQKEKGVLVRYIGWGGIKGVFNPDNKEWGAQHRELVGILTEEEYAAAKRSQLDAHYTSETIITRGVWAAMKRFGFRGGKMYEGGVGIGHFIGLMPDDMRAGTHYIGIEQDKITAAIAGYLYPEAKIWNMGFQDANLSAGSADGVVGNPPFGQQSLYDKNFRHLSKFSIHNYFIAKQIELMRPGAVAGFVVSHNFMDALDSTAREHIGGMAQFLGAIRLPNTAFKGNANTEVVTDLVFFKKTHPGNTDRGPWTQSAQRTDEATGAKYSLNRWINDSPQMVLGTPSMAGSQYRENEYTVEEFKGRDLGELLDAAVLELPDDVYEHVSKDVTDRLTNPVNSEDFGDAKVGGYVINKDGEIYRRMADVDMERRFEPAGIAAEATKERMRGMIQIRDAMNALVAAEMSDNAGEKQMDALRKKLNGVYDAFVKGHGPLNKQANRRAFYNDPQAARILGLEKDYDNGVSKALAKKNSVAFREPSATKADIFSKRTNVPYREVTHADTAVEALAVSLNQRGDVSVEYMEELTGMSREKILEDLEGLVFELPEGGFEVKDLYLAGNVRTKLRKAKEAAELNTSFNKNVDALERVQPAPLMPEQIRAPIGAPWIPPDVYGDFAESLIGERPSSVTYMKSNGGWAFRQNSDSLAANQTWGVPRTASSNEEEGSPGKPFGDIMNALMNTKPLTVYITVDKKRVVHQSATAAAIEKAEAIKDKWEQWLFSDRARRDKLTATYNERVNNYADAVFDGKHLTFPGKSALIDLRRHQADVAWRIITQGSTLLDHVVGAGKTFAGAAAFAEMRRTGRVRKPLFVVPNHLVTQWRDDFIKLYPNANILYARPSDFAKNKRQVLFSKILTGEYDAIIIGHSSLKKIGMDPAGTRELLAEMVAEIIETIRALSDDPENGRVITNLERQKESLEAKMARLADRGKADDVVTFEELGIDALFVDEAHEFKNLFYTTQMQRVAGLGNPSGSGRAFDLYLKTRQLRKRFGAKAPIVFATGTPLSNSLVEMFTMQRYLQPDVLNDMQVTSLDAWAKVFADVKQVYEVDPTGTGYRMSTRFAEFQNVGDLSAVYKTVADVITQADLEKQAQERGETFPIPRVEGGKPTVFAVKRSRDQEDYFGLETQHTDEAGNGVFDAEGNPVVSYPVNTINWRIDNMPADQRIDNMLKLTSDARKAGLDMRLINPLLPEPPGSKINVAVRQMLAKYKQWSEDRGTQLVFCDLSIPSSARGKAKAKLEAAKAEIYWTQGANDGIITVLDKERQPAAVDMPARPDLKFFVAKAETPKRWLVAERSTGLVVAYGASKKEAGENADANLKRASDTQMEAFLGRVPPDEVVAAAMESASETETDEVDEDNDASDDSTEEVSMDELLAEQSSFSVYDDVRDKLIAGGIPAEEIAFIHDFDSPEKKAKLFADVNSGRVRILMGSTPKLGAGTNVQERMVALHHLDAPWRPSDLAQREGRIIRQGNTLYKRDPEGFRVMIGRYGTELTYDARMWQIIEHKAAGIEGFKRADRSTRTMEDIAGEAANAADMKAATSGNPLIRDEIEMRGRLEKLLAQQRAWQANQYTLDRDISYYEEEPRRVTDHRKAIQAKIDVRDKGTPKKGFEMEIRVAGGDKINFSKKDGIAQALADSVRYMNSTKQAAWPAVGDYRGFTIGLEIHKGKLYVTLGARGVPRETVTDYSGDDTINDEGFVQRLDNHLGGLDAKLNSQDYRVEAAAKKLKDLNEAKKTPFTKAAEIEETRQKHTAIRSKLMESRKAAPQQQRSSGGGSNSVVVPPLSPVNPDLMTPEIVDVLRRSKITGAFLKLPEQLDPKLYKQVNAAIESAGGRWDKYVKSHIFAGNPTGVLGLGGSGTVSTQDPEAWEREAETYNAELDAIEAALEAGESKIGNPDLAYSMAGDRVRAVDEWRKNNPPAGETHAQWEEEAGWLEEAMGGRDKAWQALLEKMQRGDILTDRETKLADRYLIENERDVGTPAKLGRAREFAMAYRRSGTEAARSLGSRRDMFMTPAERWHRYLFNLATQPDEGAKKAAGAKRGQAEDAPTEGEKTKARREADRIEDESSRRQLAQVEKALKAAGFTLDEFLNTNVRITNEAPVFMRLLREMAEWKRGVLTKLQGGDVPFKSIAKQLGRTEKEVRQVREEFEAKFREWALAELKPGMTADDLIALTGGAVKSQAVGAEMSEADKNRIIAEAMMKMGLVPPDKQGKTKVREKRTGAKQQLSPDEMVQRIMGRWKNRGNKNPSPVAEASRAYAAKRDITDGARDGFAEKLQALGVSKDMAAGMAEEAHERLKSARMGTKEKFVTYLDLEDAEAVVAAAKTMHAGRGDVIDMVTEYLYFSMLSGPKTQVVNAASYPMMLVGDMGATRGLAAVLNTAFGWVGAGNKMAPQLGEFGPMLKALLPGLADAWKLSAKAAKTGVDYLAYDKLHDRMNGDPENFEKLIRSMGIEIPRSAIPGIFGKVVRLPFRGMQFMDVFGKTTLAHLEAAAWALRIARREQKGRTFASKAARMADLEGRMTELVTTPGSEAWKRAIAAATESGFQTPLEGGLMMPENAVDDFERAIAGILARVDKALTQPGKPGAKGFIGKAVRTAVKVLLLPFARTPYNIARMGLRKSPLGAVALTARFVEAGYSHLFGRRDFGEVFGSFFPHLAEQILSWGAMLLLWGAVEGDDDDDEKKLLIAGGPLPGRGDREENLARDARTGGNFIIRIGGKDGWKIPFGRYEPIATVLGTTADMVRSGKMDKATTSERMNRLFAGIVGQAEEKTFMRGLADVISVIDDVRRGDGKVTERWALRTLGMAVPNIIKAPMRDTDDWQREYRTAEAAYTFLPLAKYAEKKVLPITGGEVVKEGPAWLRVFIPTANKTTPLPRYAEAVVNYNADRTGKPFEDGGSWAPGIPGRNLSGHPLLAKGQDIELAPQAYNYYIRKTGEEARRQLSWVTESQAKNPSMEVMERIKAAWEDAGKTVREGMRKSPVKSLGTVK